ncbi:MAG: hypothetical protein K2Y20_15805 [Sphingomonas sp.]|nr:hypothetical protein [Sphingomonas sp.]
MPRPDAPRRPEAPQPGSGLPWGLVPVAQAVVSRRLAPGMRLVILSAVNKARKKRGPGPTEGEPCPVAPNRPLDLSGGAAAALEYDD